MGKKSQAGNQKITVSAREEAPPPHWGPGREEVTWTHPEGQPNVSGKR